VAFLLVEREILDVDSTDALENGRRHPGVVAIIGERNLGFVFLQRPSGICVLISAGKDTTIYNDRDNLPKLQTVFSFSRFF